MRAGDPGGRPEARVRVLEVITRLELGGAQRVVLDLAAGLDRVGFAVGLAWGPGDRLDGAAEEIADLERLPVPALVREPRPARDRAALAGLRAAVRAFRPDLVHTHSSKAGILGRLAARLEGVAATVHTVHGFGFTPLQRLPVRAAFFLAERAAARWTDHTVVVAETHRRQGLELGLFEPGSVSVIRAAVDLARYRSRAGGAEARRRLGLPEHAPLVVQVGNFKPQKAPLDFVRTAAEVARSVPGARFVMAGDGPLRPRCERLAARLGLAGRLSFAGWWEDVPGLLAAAEVAVLTSRHEGLPCSVVEALASGVPVVATAVDGTVEVVRDGVNGFLAPAGEVGALAGRVIRLLTDPGLRERLAVAAPVGLEEWEVATMVRRHEELYRCLTRS